MVTSPAFEIVFMFSRACHDLISIETPDNATNSTET
jgi:hypothetical protein